MRGNSKSTIDDLIHFLRLFNRRNDSPARSNPNSILNSVSTASSFILHCRYILRRVSWSLVHNIIPLGFRECGGEGYAEVYRGKLSSGEAIAVNRLLKLVQMMRGRRSFD